MVWIAVLGMKVSLVAEDVILIVDLSYLLYANP